MFPYTGQKDENLIRSLMKDMHRTLPENVHNRTCYTGTKLGNEFNIIKNPVKTGRKLNESIIDHNGRDQMSNLYKHSQESNHPCVAMSRLRIIGSNFRN